MRTNQHNKAVHVLANALSTDPMTLCHTLINVGKLKAYTLDNTISS